MNSIAALVILAGFAGQNNTIPARNNQVPPGFNTVQPTNLFAGNRSAPSQTRAGTVYAPSNNLAPGAGSAPSLGPIPSSMNNGNRTYQRRVGTTQSLVVNGYRWGYVHYRRDWRDTWFNFPCYAYTPYAYATQFPSPWYTYYSLPPYIYGNNIVFNAPPYLSWDYQYYYGQQQDLDAAIRTIIASFQYGRERDIEDLIPRRGLVAVSFNGRYEYSLPADEFLELYEDGIYNSRTTGYRINQIWMSGEYARVVATHYFLDPWGRQRTAPHVYLLSRERRDYVIREFGVG